MNHRLNILQDVLHVAGTGLPGRRRHASQPGAGAIGVLSGVLQLVARAPQRALGVLPGELSGGELVLQGADARALGAWVRLTNKIQK